MGQGEIDAWWRAVEEHPEVAMVPRSASAGLGFLRLRGCQCLPYPSRHIALAELRSPLYAGYVQRYQHPAQLDGKEQRGAALGFGLRFFIHLVTASRVC